MWKHSGYKFQGVNAIAIGSESGMWTDEDNHQGDNAVAIGHKAGCHGQNDNSIIIDATGDGEIEANHSGLFIKPIRQTAENNTDSLYFKYGSITGEIFAVTG